jgi:hypothetical protein
MNYWAPLHDKEAEAEPGQNNIVKTKQSIANTNSNEWTRRIERRRAMKLVIDSGATSNFVPEEMNLPKKEKPNKEVFLPDNTKLQATYRTELPLKQLSRKAREADILPGLKTPLFSINKMAKEGYSTIFHPGEEGVTVHQQGTVSIITTEPPVLQGCKRKGAKYGQYQRTTNQIRKEQTKFTTYHRSTKPSDTCTQRQPFQQKRLGSKPSKPETTTHGRP